MNNFNKFESNNPNKTKKCNCENKVGPKTFSNSNEKNNYNSKSK